VEDLTVKCLSILAEKLLSDKDISNPEAFLWRMVYNQFQDFIWQKYRKPYPFSLDEDAAFSDAIESQTSRHYQDKMQEIWQKSHTVCTNAEVKLLQEIYLNGKKSSQLAA